MTPSTHPEIRIEEEVDGDQWATLLRADPRATFFHRLSWITLYARHHGGEPRFITARSQGRLVGAVPLVRFPRGPVHFLESLPLGTYGGPLIDPTPGASEVADALLRRFAALARNPLCARAQCVIRRPDPVTDGRGFGPGEIHVVPLGLSFDDFWYKTFPRNRRTECNRAEKEGVEVEIERGRTRHLEAFYPLHLDAHRRWQLRPHPRLFFEEILAAEPRDALFVSVHHQGRLLGAHVSFVSGDEIVAWHGTTAKDVQKALNPAAMLIKAQAIEAIGLGLARINLGGSGGRAGIESFKKLVGGQEDRTAVLETRSLLDRVIRRLPRAASPRD